jgi:uncharacterized membrane protein YraQ (UPF0718 family)
MTFAPILAVAALRILGWLFAIVGALLVVLFARRWLIDGATPPPYDLLLVAALAALLLPLCRYVAARLERLADVGGK